jgi:hypothetical protein
VVNLYKREGSQARSTALGSGPSLAGVLGFESHPSHPFYEVLNRSGIFYYHLNFDTHVSLISSLKLPDEPFFPPFGPILQRSQQEFASGPKEKLKGRVNERAQDPGISMTRVFIPHNPREVDYVSVPWVCELGQDGTGKQKHTIKVVH